MASARTRKKQIASHLFMAMLSRRLDAWLNGSDEAEKKLIANGDHVRRMQLAALVEDAKVEYVVKKVNGGEVVATFDSREDALALVLKHHRQKKAKLHVMDSSTGELVLFTEEEMA